MRIGTKSVLFGAHQFAIHPWFVAWAWWKLYGFPRDYRLWIAFFVHDLGYWGKRNMDGEDGESHPEFGAHIMARFDQRRMNRRECNNVPRAHDRHRKCFLPCDETDKCYWEHLVRYHSRFAAKRDGKPFSRLCVADKLAIVLTPWWLYLPLARLTGEIHEYMKLAEKRTADGEPKYASMNCYHSNQRQWYANVQEYLRRWVDEHRDGRQDTWTPSVGHREALDGTGVWK